MRALTLPDCAGGARHAEHYRAAETVPDRGDARGIDVGVPFQLLQRRVEPRRQHRRILGHLARERLRVLRMGGDFALAVHVEREPDVARLGQAPRLVARVLVVAPPLVHDQHAGPPAARGVVPGDESLQHRLALPVLELPSLDGGAAG